MKRASLLITVLVMAFGYAQAPDTLWTKTHGGSSNDGGNSIKQTSDSGYIIAGYTESFGAGGQDVWLMKTDGSGNTVWTKTYGGVGDEWAEDVHQTIDGGYIVVANTDSACLWLMKTNHMGDTLWTQTYTSEGYHVQQTSNGDYVVTGGGAGMGAAVMLLKTDASGNIIWCQYYPFDAAWEARGFSVGETSDGGYVIGGEYCPPGRYGGVALLVKTRVNGDESWRKTYGSYSIRSVRQTADNGYVGCGVVYYMSNPSLWIVKADSLGVTSWTTTYATPENRMVGYSLYLTNDNAYIFTGRCGYNVGENPDVFLLKTDENGDSLWCVVYGDNAYPDCGHEVQQTSDGGYIIVGTTESYGAGGSDMWIIKTEPDVGVEEQPTAKSIEENNDRIANIFRGPLRLPEGKTCRVFNIAGRAVEANKIQPGIYFIEIDGVVIKKVVKVR